MGGLPDVPETILPRGHLHRPPVERQASDDGSVVYFQSRDVPTALTENAGTDVMLGSSGPAQRSPNHISTNSYIFCNLHSSNVVL
jgi:hypothetical protein